MSNSYNSYDGHGQGRSVYRSDGWDAGRRGSDMKSNSNFDYPSIPQSLENLELDYQKDAIDLGRIRDKEEDEENHKHREAVREVRENYMKKLAILRVEHAKQWEEFLQLDARRRQQLAGQHVSASGFGSYNQQSYQEYENSAGNPHYSVPNVPVEPRGRYPNPMDIYHPSRPEDSYGDFQRQRRDDYGKAYNRY